MADDPFRINLTVFGRRLPITVRREDEVTFRTAAKLLNDRIEQLRDAFEAEEQVDYLIYAAVELVTQMVEMKQDTDVNSVFEVLRELNIDINNKLNNAPKGEQ